MSSATVIRVQSLSKEYRLGTINHGMLFRDLQSWWARRRGRPDPNARLPDPTASRDEQRLRGDRFLALDDVSFEVRLGEVLGVIGRNGAGKSTLLKILSRITLPSAGSIGIQGRVTSLLEVGTGFHGELSGRENVFLNGAILGMRRREVEKKLDQIVDFAEISQFLDTPVKRYSSGMYVRLAFAVAAHLDSEILVVDEVLAVGDLNFQRKCLGKMDVVRKEGRTVLFVSHNLVAVNQLCDRCILLDRGRLVAEGPTEGVVGRYVSIHEGIRQAEVDYGPPGPNKTAGIRRVAVTDLAGKVASQVAMDKPFLIHIAYDVVERVVGLMVGIQLIAEEGNQTVISLTDAELNLALMEERPAGSYRARVEIPAALLNSGPYRVRCGVSTRYGVIDVSEDVNFDVLDTTGIVQALGWERKNAVLSLQLPWDISRDAAPN